MFTVAEAIDLASRELLGCMEDMSGKARIPASLLDTAVKWATLLTALRKEERVL